MCTHMLWPILFICVHVPWYHSTRCTRTMVPQYPVPGTCTEVLLAQEKAHNLFVVPIPQTSQLLMEIPFTYLNWACAQVVGGNVGGKDNFLHLATYMYIHDMYIHVETKLHKDGRPPNASLCNFVQSKKSLFSCLTEHVIKLSLGTFVYYV